MNNLNLTGLDGSNPLGFLTALGTLDILSRRTSEPPPKLSWTYSGTWTPVLHTTLSIEGVVDALDAHRQASIESPILNFSYVKAKKEGAEAKPMDAKPVYDLKAPPDALRGWLLALRSRATLDQRQAVDLAAAFASELVQDGGGEASKPTAFHFTAGNQQFLAISQTLAQGTTVDHLREALLGPWSYKGEGFGTYSWDATTSRAYALRARNPSTDPKLTVPGADWLALWGLTTHPVVAVRKRLQTPGFSGGWKAGEFTWPLWGGPLGLRATTGLLRARGLQDRPAPQRRALGIVAVFNSAVTRTDTGGYGSFGPSVVL